MTKWRVGFVQLKAEWGRFKPLSVVWQLTSHNCNHQLLKSRRSRPDKLRHFFLPTGQGCSHGVTCKVMSLIGRPILRLYGFLAQNTYLNPLLKMPLPPSFLTWATQKKLGQSQVMKVGKNSLSRFCKTHLPKRKMLNTFCKISKLMANT